MNLRSCNNCGVVLDLDYISSPDMYDKNDNLIEDNAYYNGKKFIEVIYCPVCHQKLSRESND